MGHAHHYLQRLDRVEGEALDLAKTLYMDTALVLHLIAKARLGDDVERVAIALDYGDAPPHIIVTRDGRYVTCLARGMQHGLPTVSRSAVNRTHNLATRMREAVAAIEANGLSLKQLIDRLVHAGPFFAREDFEALQPWVSLYLPELFSLLFGLADKTNTARTALINTSAKRVARMDDDRLWRYWNRMWAIGPLLQLLVREPHATTFLTSLNHELPRISWSATRHGLFGLAMRGWWAAGRIGKFQYDRYKADLLTLAQHHNITQVHDIAYGLFAMAVRHRKLTAQTLKLFNAAQTLKPPHDQTAGPDDGSATYLQQIAASLSFALSISREELCEMSRAVGHSLILSESEAISFFNPAAPHRYTDADQIPPHTFLNRIAAFPVDHRRGKTHPSEWVMHLAEFFTLKASDTFMPRAQLDLYPSYDKTFILNNIAQSAAYYSTRVPRRNAEPKRSRNAPCPCGSGKKYKRCCLTEA